MSNHPHWIDEAVLLAPALAVLVLVSWHTGFNHHLRYVLPVLPAMFIWTSQVFADKKSVVSGQNAGEYECRKQNEECCSESSSILRRPRMAIACGLLTWGVMSSLWIYPHSLSYFNESIGGPLNGPAHLGNSNIDWGQDLGYLKRWLPDHLQEEETLHLAFDGGYDPSFLGVDYERVPTDGPRPGWHVVSVKKIPGWRGTYAYFAHFEPVDCIGYSMRVFHITREEANRVRRKMGLPEI